MAEPIIKPDPNDDFYVEWSTISDTPISSGSRTWMLAYLQQAAGNPRSAWNTPEDRLARADQDGTSAVYVASDRLEFGWSGTRLLFQSDQGHAWIRRDQLKTLCRRLEHNLDVSDLLEVVVDDNE